MIFWINYFPLRILFFGGLFYGVLVSVILKIFVFDQPRWLKFLLSPFPHQKKASYNPEYNIHLFRMTDTFMIYLMLIHTWTWNRTYCHFRLLNYWLVLIYDLTVSGLLKIKLICSICFHRVCHKILEFRPFTSRLTPFFLVWGHVINRSKQYFLSSPLHRRDLSCYT